MIIIYLEKWLQLKVKKKKKNDLNKPKKNIVLSLHEQVGINSKQRDKFVSQFRREVK